MPHKAQFIAWRRCEYDEFDTVRFCAAPAARSLPYFSQRPNAGFFLNIRMKNETVVTRVIFPGVCQWYGG